jgi:hypothetical protein
MRRSHRASPPALALSGLQSEGFLTRIIHSRHAQGA